MTAAFEQFVRATFWSKPEASHIINAMFREALKRQLAALNIAIRTAVED